MSFSPDVRASGNFRRQFAKEKRRLQLSEIPKSDIDSLQEHVVEIRTATQFLDCYNTRDNENIQDIPLGPHDYIFEPDYNTVKLRTCFMDPYGIGTTAFTAGGVDFFQTLNGINYYCLELYDQAASTSRLWYAIPSFITDSVPGPDFNLFWKWKLGFRGPNLKRGDAIALNVGSNTNQFAFVSSLGSNFDFTSRNLSCGFWIYPTDLSNNGSNSRILAYRRIDANNKWSLEIDTSDQKLFEVFRVAGVDTKRQYDTALVANNWYFIAWTWTNGGPTIVLKVNDNADTSSTKGTTTGATDAGLYFGSYPGASSGQDFKGYITGLTYYDNTVLNTTELTSLYNYNTKSATTKPGIWGIMQYGTPPVVGGSFTTTSFTATSFTTS